MKPTVGRTVLAFLSPKAPVGRAATVVETPDHVVSGKGEPLIRLRVLSPHDASFDETLWFDAAPDVEFQGRLWRWPPRV
jgi:hypothetical protein